MENPKNAPMLKLTNKIMRGGASPAEQRKVNTPGTAEYETKTERLEHKAGNVKSDKRSEKLYGRVKKRDKAAGHKYSAGVEIDD